MIDLRRRRQGRAYFCTLVTRRRFVFSRIKGELNRNRDGNDGEGARMKNHRLTVRGKRILLLFRFFCPNRKSSSSPSPILPRVYAVYFRHSFTGEIFCTYERPALLSSSFIVKVPRMKNPSRFISIRDLCAQQRPSCKFHGLFSRPVFHNPLLNPLPRRNFLRISFSTLRN